MAAGLLWQQCIKASKGLRMKTAFEAAGCQETGGYLELTAVELENLQNVPALEV